MLRDRRVRILLASCVVMALTAPGQTAAMSVFIDPIIGSLHIGRPAISAVYLVATLASAAALTPVGRALDRYGIRVVTLLVVAALSLALLGFSRVGGLATLLVGFAALRILGQGALSLSGSQAVTVVFNRRRGTAMGLASAIGNAGVALSPVLLSVLIAHRGWRATAVIEAAVVLAVLVPTTLIGLRGVDAHRVPAGRQVGPAAGGPPQQPGATLAETLRTPMFWAMAAALSSTSLLGTGLAFHQISLLGTHGLSATAAAANFVPQTAATLAVSLITGPLLDRLPGRAVMAASMVLLALALVLATTAAPGWRVLMYAIALGAANGGLRAQEATILPRYYGLTYLGAIRGAITAISIAASAFGPLALALGDAAFGGYTPILLILVVLPAGAATALLLAPDPRSARSPVPT